MDELYRQKHAEIWPEMADTLHRFGIHNYSIFRRGLVLFAYLECDDPARLAAQRADPVRNLTKARRLLDWEPQSQHCLAD